MKCQCCGQPLPTKINKHSNEFFDQFWAKYPRKEGKKAAYKVWLRINPTLEETKKMLSTLDWQLDWLWEDHKYIPHPTTYLNGERYNDEPPPNVQAQLKAKNVGQIQYPRRVDESNRHGRCAETSAKGRN